MRVPTMILALFLAVPLGGGAAWAQAQTTQPPQATNEPLEAEQWTVTPFLGFSFGGDLDDSPLSLGAALAYNWNTRIAIEGAFSYMNGEQGLLFDFDTNVYTIDANVVYHFAEERFIPYVTGGLGVMHASADLDDLNLPGVDDSSTELAFNLGGGVKTNLSERVRFRGDLRYYNGDDLAPDFWRLSAGLAIGLGSR